MMFTLIQNAQDKSYNTVAQNIKYHTKVGMHVCEDRECIEDHNLESQELWLISNTTEIL